MISELCAHGRWGQNNQKQKKKKTETSPTLINDAGEHRTTKKNRKAKRVLQKKNSHRSLARSLASAVARKFAAVAFANAGNEAVAASAAATAKKLR
jgi:hypothetical protein